MLVVSVPYKVWKFSEYIFLTVNLEWFSWFKLFKCH